MLADLHIHTDASDGTWSPSVLVKKVKERGLGLFAVADHDSVMNVAQTQILSKSEGIRYLRSVEISSIFDGNFFHILGYEIDIENKKLSDLLSFNISIFFEFQERVIKGFSLSIDDFRNYTYDKSRGGMKILNFMIDRGACKDIVDYIRLVYKENSFDPPPYKTVKEVVQLIKDAGGVPVLAHPGSKLTSSGLKIDDLKKFTAWGIEGLECYSQYHDKKTTEDFVNFCNEHDLLITGGSDCHGDFIPTRRLGYPEVDVKDLRLGKLI